MPIREVQLPLKSLEQCAVCRKKSSELKLCSFCGEVTYCSTECQTGDWVKHKRICGKEQTDRISLDQFHPILAVLAESNRLLPARPMHPAITRQIINSPNPYVPEMTFPDGTSAKLVKLGKEIGLTVHPVLNTEWWPTALSDQVRGKLVRRFLREGHTLPLISAVLVALLSEMYTSPDGNSSLRRTRLNYKSSPIADFGIAKGRATVTPQDMFAFWDTLTDRFWLGQDPNDHYWIYFTTLKGEELVLDFGMFTFNNCTIISAEPYIHPNANMVPAPPSPCYFRNRSMARNAPTLHTETGRVSVLRNKNLHRFVEQELIVECPHDCSILFDFMESFSSRPLTVEEKKLTEAWIFWNTKWLKCILSTRHWVNWPAEPALAIEQDPGEMAALDKWTPPKDMKKKRKSKKREYNKETIGKVFNRWENRV
ncbi:hypothetical protein C8R41DRAFT_793151 [Lentinula lateritia]|uniref:MYND-type domain-containing protein n=1 Tax=Lentinula lateritia TaxID=40482 RepID=A0ABQ8VL88_9AGAR|nr:hypothetical protein C8R41DRAFT_793151 [Lentinula lateritia]